MTTPELRDRERLRLALKKTRHARDLLLLIPENDRTEGDKYAIAQLTEVEARLAGLTEAAPG